ncbi:NTP transferase domain-containing protein [Candidatus Daviesbacteria bacterium]|nr:NTP transferase domain-containing protein [Candidatus Daviesbacteria bacterium]
MINSKDLEVIILAAGKGSRLNSGSSNKVVLEVQGTPLIQRTIDTLRQLNLKNILVVVGHAKDSVLNLLDKDIQTVEQIEQLGTAHAVKVALEVTKKHIKNCLVLNGDDSFLLSKEVLEKLINHHLTSSNKITFLTTHLDNPKGLGRIIRDTKNNLVKIVEEKEASEAEKKVKEVNLAAYLFDLEFLRENIDKVKKSQITSEYYLVTLVEQAMANHDKVEMVFIKDLMWRGINTQEELEEAKELADI